MRTISGQKHFGAVYDVNGKRLATIDFKPISPSQYMGYWMINAPIDQVFIFTDGQHVLKFMKSVTRFHKSSSTLKSKKTDNENIDARFVLNDPNGQYQPLDTSFLSLQNSEENYVDFFMKQWPEFFANVFLQTQDKWGEKLSDVQIQLDNYNITSNEKGEATITNIPIPAQEQHKLTADTLQVILRLEKEQYHQLKDTIALTQGDYSKIYQLTPQQQEFLAQLNITIQDKTRQPLQNVFAELWQQANEHNSYEQTINQTGTIQNIIIPPHNEIIADTANYILRLTRQDFYEQLDTVTMTAETYEKTYTLQPTIKPYQLTITSQLKTGEQNPLVNWLVLDAQDTTHIIGAGNTEEQATDTLRFNNTAPELDVIVKGHKDMQTNFRKELTLQSNNPQNITITTEQLYNFLVHVYAQDAQTKEKLDSLEVTLTDLQKNEIQTINTLQDTLKTFSFTDTEEQKVGWINFARNNYESQNNLMVVLQSGEQNIHTDMTYIHPRYFSTVTITGYDETTNTGISGMNVHLWGVHNNKTYQKNTSELGSAKFYNVHINQTEAGEPETTPYVVRMTMKGKQDVQDTIQLQEEEYHFSYKIPSEQEDQLHQIVLHTKDATGNELPNVNWNAYTTNDTINSVAWGNSGSDARDTLSYSATQDNIPFIIKTTKEEYHPARFEHNAPIGISTLHTHNAIQTYLFELLAGAKHSETQEMIPNTTIEMYTQQGTALESKNTNSQTTATLTTTQPGHEFPVKLVFKNDNFITSDTIETLLQEGTLHQIITPLDPVQQEFFAQLNLTINNSETNNGEENVQTSIWKTETNNTYNQTTNNQGKTTFNNIPIEAKTATTAGTSQYVIKAQKEPFNTLQDTINITNGTHNKTYTLQYNPQTNKYEIILHTKEGEQNLPNTNWNTNFEGTTHTGNTGTNSIDTLILNTTKNKINLNIETNKKEYNTQTTTQENITPGTTTITTQNTIKQYLYETTIQATNEENGNTLDSIDVDMIYDGKLVDEAFSGSNTKVTLEMTKPGHEQTVTYITNRKGYQTDTLETTIKEGEQNNITTTLTPEQQEQQYGYITRFVTDKNGAFLKDVDIVIENSTLNYYDTKTTDQYGMYQDTIPINGTNEEYTLSFHKDVVSGDIPYYDLEKIITFVPETNTIEMDILHRLAQQQRLSGTVNSPATIIIYDGSGNIQETIETNGNYTTNPLPLDFSGQIDVVAESGNHYNHRGIPIISEDTEGYGTSTGAVRLPEKITNFTDTLKTYHISCMPHYWQHPISGEQVALHPEQIRDLDGNYSYFYQMLNEEPINVYFETSVNGYPINPVKEWAYYMANFIEENYGIPYSINEISSPTTYGINLVSARDQGAGITHNVGGYYDENVQLDFHTEIDMRIRPAPEGTPTNDDSELGSAREMIMRSMELGPTSRYGSITNYSTPRSWDEVNMTQDVANINYIYTIRKARVQGQVHTGSWTNSDE